jgi:hypothetical protein
MLRAILIEKRADGTLVCIGLFEIKALILDIPFLASPTIASEQAFPEVTFNRLND